MGAAARAAAPPSTPAPAAKHPSPLRPRPPLIPSEKDNAPRRPRNIPSRYLASPSPSPSTSTSTSSTSSSSASSAAPRRHPSPLPALTSPSPAPRRSSSVGRPRPRPAPVPPPSATTTTTRSLSVSFQGESFFYQTSKAKPTPRRPSTPTRSPTPKPDPRPLNRWPAARTSLTRSLDYSSLNPLPPPRPTPDSHDQSASSDTDSASSGSNSGTVPPRGPRFWHDNPAARRKPPDAPRNTKLGRSAMDSAVSVSVSVSSPRGQCSPLRGPVRAASPSRAAEPRRGAASPLRGRGGGVQQQANAPSIISFAAELRRSKKGENRIEEAHMLRLLHNRQLQWRFVNARAAASLRAQRFAVEKNLYNTWTTISAMRDSVTIKRIKLQLLTQNFKVTSILKGQMSYLEEWSLMERDHSTSLTGAIEALKASTLRLPVVDGAKADLHEVKDAVGSALDVMQAMGSSICSLLSKVEGAGSLVSELAKVARQEQALLDQSRELLSRVAGMHVTQCSLQGHILQLKRSQSQKQL